MRHGEDPMSSNRRQFLGAAAPLACGFAAPAASNADFEAVRKQFPRVMKQVYLDAAANMPLPAYTAEGMRRYMDFHMYGPGEGRGQYASQALREVKPLFAK